MAKPHGDFINFIFCINRADIRAKLLAQGLNLYKATLSFRILIGGNTFHESPL